MATLTVGDGKTYSTIAAAIAAADVSDTVEISPKNADQSTTSIYNETLNNDKSLTFRGIGPVGISSILDVTWNSLLGENVFEDLTFLFAQRIRNTSSVAGVSAIFRRCRMLQFVNQPVWHAIRAQFTLTYHNCFLYSSHFVYLTAAETINFYNCNIVSGNQAGTAAAAIVANGGITNVYNCKIFGATSVSSTSPGVLNEDYNEGDATLLGANDILRTAAQAGLNLSNNIFEGRTDRDFELPGTTTAGATDLTALYMTDIDGRARPATAAGYAIGCTHGYKDYQFADWPLEADVRLATSFDNGEKIGTLEVKDLTFAEEATRNTDPGIANVLLDTTYRHLDIPLIGELSVGDKPDTPVIDAVINGDGQVTLTLTAADESLPIVARYKRLGTHPWNDDSITRTGSGDLVITGLTNKASYDIVVYHQSAIIMSDWSNPVLGLPTDGSIIVGADPNWVRWVFASVCKHFDDRRGDLKMFIEGQRRDAKPPKDFIELRLDGPYITEINKGYFRLFLEINVIVQCRLDDVSYHRVYDVCGQVASIFTAIPSYKYGSGTEDTQQYLGCLNLLQDTQSRKRIQINHFGEMRPNLGLVQSSVEGHYEMFLSKE